MKLKVPFIFFIWALLFITLQLFIVKAHSESLIQSEAKNDIVKIQKIEKMYNWYKRWFFSNAKSITVGELLKLKRKEDVILVDNRSEKAKKRLSKPSFHSLVLFSL